MPSGPSSPVLAVALLLEAGKLQAMDYSSFKQKLGCPEAQSAGHKGYGCHSKG